jgi:hypothetical protein
MQRLFPLFISYSIIALQVTIVSDTMAKVLWYRYSHYNELPERAAVTVMILDIGVPHICTSGRVFSSEVFSFSAWVDLEAVTIGRHAFFCTYQCIFNSLLMHIPTHTLRT